MHSPTIGEIVKQKKKRADNLASTCREGATVKLCVDSNVAEERIDGHYAIRKSAYAVRENDDHVKHSLTSQEY